MARDTAFRERYFLRYLTRDHFDLVKCKKRLIATFEWRVSFGLDNGPIDRFGPQSLPVFDHRSQLPPPFQD